MWSNKKRKSDVLYKTKAIKYAAKPKETVSLAVKQYIKKAVAQSEEVKVANYISSSALQGFNLGVAATSWYNNCVLPLCPYGGFMNIQQGSGQGDRIGNKIRTKKCVLEYVISPKVYDATTNSNSQPYWVKMWVVTPKDDPTALPTIGSFSGFFQSGDTTSYPGGAVADLLYEVNDDLFKLHTYRTHKIGAAVQGGTGGPITWQYFSNNDFSITAKGKIDVTKYLPKEFQFNDNAPYPNNSLAYLVMECVPISGFTNGNLIPLLFTYSLKYEFTDA